jgi:hemerythrin
MEWTKDLAVGVEKIDEQHKELFKRIGGLVDAVKSKTCKYVIGDVIGFLHDYVIEHFSDEEKIMRKYRYPEFEEHRAQHDKFIREFDTLEDNLRNETSSYTRSVYTNQIVVDWITEHISKVDKKLGAYIKAQDAKKKG